MHREGGQGGFVRREVEGGVRAQGGGGGWGVVESEGGGAPGGAGLASRGWTGMLKGGGASAVSAVAKPVML